MAMKEHRITTLTVLETRAIERRNDPLVWGVPLAQGVVREPGSLVLREMATGRRMTMQAEATARWPDGSVKWALVTLPTVTLGARKRMRLELRAASGAKSAAGAKPSKSSKAPRAAVTVHEREDGTHIDTGRLRFVVARQGSVIP